MRRLRALQLAVVAAILLPAPAHASEGAPCELRLNGVEMSRIAGLGSPLVLHTDEELVLTAGAPEGSAGSLALTAGPVVVERVEADALGGGRLTASIPLRDLSRYTVGLVGVHARTDGCDQFAWLRITGRFPVATLAGLAGAGLFLGGVGGGFGLMVSRRQWVLPGVAIGGALAGSGIALLAQQWGRLQPSYPALLGFAGAAALTAAALAYRLQPSQARSRPRQRDTTAEIVRAAERAATAPEPVEIPQPEPQGPYWGYVLAPTDVVSLADHSSLVGSLVPGTWYLVHREVGAWAHVTGPDGLEGWSARHAIRRQG